MKTCSFKRLIAALILLAAYAMPVYSQQVADSVKDDNEKNKPNAYQLFGYGDAKMDSLAKQLNDYSKVIYNYDHSRKYETLKLNSQGFSKPTMSFYANDTLRRLMGQIYQITQYFDAHSTRDISLKRDSLGRLIGDYFKTQKFIAINLNLQRKYNIDPAKNYDANDNAYNRYHNELFGKMPAPIRREIEELKRLSNQLREQVSAPQQIAYLKQMPVLIDSMKSYYKKPHTAQYTYASYEATMDISADQRKQAQDELRDYLNNSDFRHAMELLNESGQKMHDYYNNTPVVKEHEEAWRNELKTILANDYTDIVHPSHDLKF